MKHILGFMIFGLLPPVSGLAFVQMTHTRAIGRKAKYLPTISRRSNDYELRSSKPGNSYEVEKGPVHHLIEVDHEEMRRVEKEKMDKGREYAKLLTLAWCLFILPIFLHNLFEIVYLI